MRTGRTRVPGRVDQILFVWSERLLIGGSGLGPVATSLGPDDLRMWNDRLLGGDVVVGQWHRGGAECAALGALQGRRGEHGVVLRLLPARDANGRVSQLVHALVGPAAAVDARLALGLHRWPHWVTPEQAADLPPRLLALDAGELRSAADRELDALPARPEPLAGLLADALAAPSARYLADIEAADIDLVAGLLHRLDGAAGEEPWTVMLGATVTRSELRPRLLVLDLEEGRRGRVPLSTAPTGDPALDRAGELLAGLPAASLTPPQRPLTTPAALLEWVETEYQRATEVLELVDRAIAGTLDDDARRHLDGPSGRERLRAELWRTGAAELADRLDRWAARPPSGLDNAARTLRGIAAERYLAEVGESRDAPEQLVHAARRMGSTPAEASDVLSAWFGGLAQGTPMHRWAAVYFAIWFGVDLAADRTIDRVLHGMPPDDVLDWAAKMAADGETRGAGYFMRAAYDRWRRGRGQAGDEKVRTLLADTGMLHETIHRLVAVPDSPPGEETELYRIVLCLAYGAPIHDLGPVLDALPVDGAAMEFRPWLAVARVVERQPDLVLRVAEHAFRLNPPQAVLDELLKGFAGAELIAEMAGQPRPDVLAAACTVLHSRRHSVDERPGNRKALLANRFLTDEVESAFPTDHVYRFWVYELLLDIAYETGDRGAGTGTGLNVTEVDGLLALGGPPVFAGAVLGAAGADAALHVLLEEKRRQLIDLGLPVHLVDQATRAPHRPVPEIGRVATPAPFEPFGSVPGHHQGRHVRFPGKDRFPAEREPADLDAPRGRWWSDIDPRNVLMTVGFVAFVLLLVTIFAIYNGRSDGDPAPTGPTAPISGPPGEPASEPPAEAPTPAAEPTTGQNP